MKILKFSFYFFILEIVNLVLGVNMSLAGDLLLKGTFIQGGLITGYTEPGAQVLFNNKNIRVSNLGVFLIGFGRNSKDTATIKIKFPDSNVIKKKLYVKKRNYIIQRIDGLPQKQVKPGPKDIEKIRSDNKKITNIRRLDTADTSFISGFQWPAIGPISGVFGSQRILNGIAKSPHNGVDVAAPKGSPVTAASDGTIVLVQNDMFYTGKTIMINHGHGLSSIYVHMDKILIKKGQKISKGQKIGTIGSTGRATGPHLHWGISLFDVHLDPSLLVGKMPRKPEKE